MSVVPKGWTKAANVSDEDEQDASALTDAKLGSSGITGETAERAGLTYVDRLREADWLGFGHRQRDVMSAPALLLPYFDFNGEPLIANGQPFYRARLLTEVTERGRDGKPVIGRSGKPKLVRYLQPPKSGCQLYMPPIVDWRSVADDTSIDVLVVEGELKAVKGCQEGYVCLGLGGVANWSERGPLGRKRLLRALRRITWTGRRVFLVGDSDLRTNPHAWAAFALLARELATLGADVRDATLPEIDRHDKVGLDDFLLARTTRDLDALLAKADPMCEADVRVAELNAEYAYVFTSSERPVLHETWDHGLGVAKIDFLSEKAFAGRFPELVANPATGKAVELGKFWLKHEMRRQYPGGVTFAPGGAVSDGVLNLWRGFSVEPAPGDWSPLKTHLRENLCSGDEVLFEYLMNWLARAVQRPDTPGEVMIIFRGQQGTGKGKFWTWFMKLFGPHGLHLQRSNEATGRFNAQLQTCVFAFADEAFFAGDPAHARVLKGLITEKRHNYERKFHDATQAPNFMHLGAASNEDWVYPAELDDRRALVIDVPTHEHTKDPAYFAAIDRRMEAGGLAAMLHELLSRDIAGFNVLAKPATAADEDQKKITAFRRGTFDGFVFEVLSAGEIACRGDGGAQITWVFGGEHKGYIARGDLRGAFDTWAGKHGGRGLSDEHVGRELKRLLGSAFLSTEGTKTPRQLGAQRRAYRFDSLVRCREEFSKTTGLKFDEGDDD